MSELIPAVVFAYRRPALLRRTLASLRANNVPKIYAFSDGPRDAEAAADVEEVRAIFRAVDWAPLELVAAPRNMGVLHAEIGGITRVLAAHEMAVFVEEDLEFYPGTYDFICEGLRRYRDNPRVMGVTGWNHRRVTPPGVTQPYFCGRMSGLMWGTWRRAWAGMPERNSAQYLDDCRARGIDPARWGHDLVASVPHEEERGFWDLRFNLHMLANDGLFLFPAVSMTRHIGYGPGAWNSPNAAGWEDDPAPPPAPESVRWPTDVRALQGSDALWRSAIAGAPPTLMQRAKRLLRRWMSR